ncbi:hypothetical protein ElyMa_002832200 [Elysia marginata]|uniref:Uncharacterized protein n=1 Tax=Elysia marginata TaxID=1093978 RepID=A0AAV4HVY9_9GAST|nr:hypothetical protein ElyMa_002832200 [Elysia marginata]
MGATQSKKRRKERKRRRRQHGGPSSAHFDVPRSVSLDALRSYGVTPSSPAPADCPHCGGWSWGNQGGGRAERRTFSGLLESSGACHGFHRCLRGQYDDMQGSGYQLGGYDSDDDTGRWSHHVSCPTCSPGMSQEDMTSQASLHAPTLACPGPEHSTMSLNRHAGLRVNSKISQSRSSEFSELLDILRRHEKIRASLHEAGSDSTSQRLGQRRPHSASSPLGGNSTSPVTLPDQSNRVAISSAAPNTVQAPALVPSNTKFPTPPPTQVLQQADESPPVNKESSSTRPTTISSITNPATTPTTSSTLCTTTTTTATTKSKKPITVLEDEETRLARWEKQKLMAEQFRLLRKHLLAREESLKANKCAGRVSEPLPLSLKGPLDAVEAYLSSQSNSNSSLKSGDFTSSLSKTSSVQSLPNPSHEGSQTSSHVQHTQTALPLTCVQGPINRDVERREANSTRATSSFTFSSSTQHRTVQTRSCSATVGDTTLSSTEQQSQSLAVTSSQSQTLQGRSKFKRQGQNFRNLDNHPVLSRLQNEQNSRLERMERKMRCIRASAEQAAERKKFEQIFPARQEALVEDEKQRMKEAEESLAKLKEENKRKQQIKKALQSKNSQKDLSSAEKVEPSVDPAIDAAKAEDSRITDDSGEVIPVRVLQEHSTDLSLSSSRSLLRCRRGSSKRKAKTEDDREEGENQSQDSAKKPHWLNSTFSKINMDLGNPLSWLVLPFLLFPLILRLLLSVALNSKRQAPPGPASRSSSPSPTPSNCSTSSREQTFGTATISQEEYLNNLSTHQEGSAVKETKILPRRCGSKVKLQRGDSTETTRLKSV